MPAEMIQVHKEARVAGAGASSWVAGFEYGLWQHEGTPSHGDVPPTTYHNPIDTTPGGLFQTNAAAGFQKWLTAVCATGNVGGRIVLYDRLLAISGLSGTVTTAQNINGGSPATLTRHYQDPAGLADDGTELFLEIYTTIGVTGTTVTAAYTDSAGNSSTTQAVAIGATNFREAQRIIRLPLAAGDTGVRDVTSVTLAATTGTAGNIGLVVAKRLLEIEIGAGGVCELWTGTAEPGYGTGFIEILSGACLAWAYHTGIANAGTSVLDAQLTFVDK